MPDFTSYVPPDVYIEEERVSLVNVIGVGPSVIGIVGPSIGYRTFTEAVTLTGTTAVALAKHGVIGASVAVLDSDGATKALTTDYVLTTTTGADASASTPDDVTTIKRATSGSTISSGATVYVTYNYADESFALPTRIRNYDQMVSYFGAAMNLSTGVVTSPLSLAAQLAFINGANEIVAVSVGTSATIVTKEQLAAGEALLDSFYDVNLIVPLPIGISGTSISIGDTGAVLTDLKAAVDRVANDNLFRIGIIGLDTGSTVPLETTVATARSERVVLAGPNRVLYYDGLLNRDIEIGGCYLAAAYAGILSKNGVHMPLTKKQVRGLSGIPGSVFTTMTGSYKNTLSDMGVALTEVTRDNTLVVRHGVTTNRTSTLTREISLIRTKDSLVNLIRSTMERSGLIGGVIDDDALANVKSTIDGVLMAAQTGRVIRGYSPPVVRQREGDPTIIEVKFQYDPLYPMNCIVVSFGINTTTGEVVPVAA